MAAAVTGLLLVAAGAATPAWAATGPRPALLVSTDAGDSWRPVPGDFPADVDAAFLEPWGQRLVLATERDGILIGVPGSQAWRRASGGLPALKITALHVEGARLYAGVFERGVWTSRDGGRAWRPLNGELPDLRVRAILATGRRLLIGTDTGIFARGRAPDTTWRRVFSGGQVTTLQGLGSRLIAGAAHGTLRSDDGGLNWAWAHRDGAAHNTAVLGSRVVLMNVSGDVYASDDGGDAFHKLDYGPRVGSYVYDIAALGDAQVMSNNYGIHRSSDGGVTWRLVHPREDLIFYELVAHRGLLYAATRRRAERRDRAR